MGNNRFCSTGQNINLLLYAETIFTHKQKTGKGYLVHCPFHNDKTPSLYITEDYAYCFACGKGWRPNEFVIATGNKPYTITEITKKTPTKRISIAPSAEIIEIAHKRLLKMYDKINVLHSRCITIDMIIKYKIGYMVPPISNCTLPRFSFPAWDTSGELKTVTYRQDETLEYPNTPNENRKYLHHPGTQVIPYNIHNINKYSWLVYVGGQIDALSLLQYNIPAIGAPGEGVFKPEWITLFEGKKVLIWLDADEAGKKGAEKIHKLLKKSIIVKWPKGVPYKYDINDAIRDPLFGIEEVRRILHSYYTRLR